MVRPALASAFLLSLLACATDLPQDDALAGNDATQDEPGAVSSSDPNGSGASEDPSEVDPATGERTPSPSSESSSGSSPSEEGAFVELFPERNYGDGVDLPLPITPEHWMARTPGLAKRKLRDIAILGTHDSGAYELVSVYLRPVDDLYAPDVPGTAAEAGQFVGLTEKWAQTQDLTLLEQLRMGVRFLDLRPCVEKNGTLRICHGMYGPKVGDLLDQVAEFAKNHPKEIVIVSMKRFAGMKGEHHAALTKLIKQKLGPYLLDHASEEITPDKTLEEIWATKKSIAVVYHDDTHGDDAFLSSKELAWHYEETWDREKKKASLETAYEQQEKAREEAEETEDEEEKKDKLKKLPLWVLDTPATPDGTMIQNALVPKSSFPDSVRELAAATNPVVQMWLRDEWLWKRTNIIIADFVEGTCLFEMTQLLNGVTDVSFDNCNIGDTSWGKWAVGPYGRGAGSPLQCPPGKEMVAGLCYTRCEPGYTSSVFFPTVCSRPCPEGYRDDGLTCFRDAKIISADNSSCPWYDKCGLTLKKGCSKCPSGYANDGCTCRRDPHMIVKARYDRGVGTIPDSCPSGTEKDGALCYPVCNSGFEGVGPMCWPTKD